MTSFLSEKPVLLPQECVGNYRFSDVKIVMTRNFIDTFGSEAGLLAIASQHMILETYSNPDKIQVFTYKGTKYWCIADFEKDDKLCDYKDLQFFYITFLLPEDY